MKALIIVDIQNDFCPGGALAVPGGDQIVPLANELMKCFDTVVFTQDWHPEGHLSFASSHPGKKPFESIEVFYGSQTLWPDHCIQKSRGAEFHAGLETGPMQMLVRKGFRRDIDSYSAFFENDHKTVTGLNGFLQERSINSIYIAGLAADFCVKWTALDARKNQLEVHVVTDAVRGIDLDGSLDQAWKEMRSAGVNLTSSSSVLC